jgi:hypothetical protein
MTDGQYGERLHRDRATCHRPLSRGGGGPGVSPILRFVLLGGAAGVLNAYRTLRRMGMIDEDGSGPGAKP